MRSIWTVACARSVQDAESRNISLIEVIEQIKATGEALEPGEVRVAPIGIDVVTLWHRSNAALAEEGRARLLIQSPSGKVLGESSYRIDLASHARMRAITRLPGVPIAESGQMKFVVELETGEGEWEPVASVPIDVQLELSEAAAN